MVSIRCESKACSCDSEVHFHAGTSSYCSEYCALAGPDAAAPCGCTHSGCEAFDHETQAPDLSASTESTVPR